MRDQEKNNNKSRPEKPEQKFGYLDVNLELGLVINKCFNVQKI